jgi:hypothetical protein
MTYGFDAVTVLAVIIYLLGVSALLLSGSRRYGEAA